MTSQYVSPTNLTNFYTNIFDILSEVDFVKKNNKLYYANIPAVFDIEASSFYDKEGNKRATMYAWVFGLNGRCIRGRTWGEFLSVIDIVSKYYELNFRKRLIIYIQNLAYEFQWFRKYFKWEKVFSLDARKPVQAVTDKGIEFRCSYILTGLSLEKTGENLIKYKVQKKVGDLDYTLTRHCLTPLTETEWGYVLNDGLVVMAKIQEEIERLGDISKIPLTKTGYVRELCRQNCLKGDNRFEYSNAIRILTMTPSNYKQLKRAYTGGFTHANIHYVDSIVLDVESFDFTSSYPAVMVSEKYPMSKPHKYNPIDAEDFSRMLKSFCCMFDCKFENIRSKVDFENYISSARCSELEFFILNNGRVVEAETLKITLTEQDFFIIKDMYEWDTIEISNFHYFYKDYLPKDLIRTVLELYKDKTELKDVIEKIEEYMVSKGMINALYGMCVTDPCRDENIYDNEWSYKKANIDEQIEKYNKDRNRTLYYAWGVWITAYARRNLFSGILEFKMDYIYSDTDSIKVINTNRHRNYIENYNKEIKNKISKCLKYYDLPLSLASPKTIKGKVKPLGVWEYEGKYTRFKTLGAKRYMIEKDGKIQITIAGVNKKAGVEYLYYKYKNNTNIFNNFSEDLTFPSVYIDGDKEYSGSGKLCHTYIDIEISGELVDYLGNKYSYYEESSIHMEPTEYTLSLAAEFVNLILGVKESHLI